MSTVDLSDPHITMAYDALANNDPLRWCILVYGNKPNVLCLSASGTGDVDEMQSHLTPDSVCYGVFRERTQDKSLYISLNYIPNTVKGVWRARTLVHGKAVSSKFKTHQVLNASDPDQVTVQAVRSILRLPPRGLQGSPTSPTSTTLGIGMPPRSFSAPRKAIPDMQFASVSLPSSRIRSPDMIGEAHPRSVSFTPTSASPHSSQLEEPSTSLRTLPSPEDGLSPMHSIPTTTETAMSASPAKIEIPSMPDSAMAQSHLPSPLLQSPRSVGTGFASGAQGPLTPHSPQHSSWLAKQESPLPPPPPSDNSVEDQIAERGSDTSDERHVSPQIGTIPDTESIASSHSSNRAVSPVTSDPTLGHSPVDGSSAPNDARSDHVNDGPVAIPLTSSPTAIQAASDISPSILAATEDSAKLSAPTKPRPRFHERAVTAADAEEERRLIILDEERRRRAAERTRREREEREEEEARERGFEERKERERKRRLESARRAEERRAQQKRQQEEEELRRQTERQRKEEEARERRDHIQKRFEMHSGMDLLSGFITLESSSSWKRRYYRLSTEDWIFFKNDEEVTTPMHAIELSRVSALREWHEGYEELEAIPHSFAVELKDDPPWLFFADSAEDKEILLGLLTQAAGL